MKVSVVKRFRGKGWNDFTFHLKIEEGYRKGSLIDVFACSQEQLEEWASNTGYEVIHESSNGRRRCFELLNVGSIPTS